MFTGIIEQTGTLVSLQDRGGVRRITVQAPGIASRTCARATPWRFSGVCLTALDLDPTFFHADLARETLDRTSLGSLAPGSKVNLELPTAAGSPLGGHVVQGRCRWHRLSSLPSTPSFRAPAPHSMSALPTGP